MECRVLKNPVQSAVGKPAHDGAAAEAATVMGFGPTMKGRTGGA
jgi:hypothetical protein